MKRPYSTEIDSTDSTEGPSDLTTLLGTIQKKVFPLSTRKNAPYALFLEHHTTMPEYPNTDKEGFLHIVNLCNYPTQIDKHRLHMDVSSHDYSRGIININKMLDSVQQIYLTTTI